MKKFLLISSAIALCATGSVAKTLTPDEALSRLNEGRAAKALSKTGTAAAKLIFTGELNNVPTYYIFSKGERTLFVGADDIAEPLLGYVDNPEFSVNEMPPVMKWWLSEYSREIEYYANIQEQQAGRINPYVTRPRVDLNSKNNAAKVAAKAASRTAISPLCATTWDQSAPYNNLMPKKNGTTTYTGCVATAMAQVMKYHNYPSKGAGSNSYTWNNQTLSMNFATTTFDWSNMLNSYPSASSGTTAQRSAIATLMKACGYAVNMEYGLDADGGSGATSFDIAPALIDNFSYDKALHTEFRDYYSTDEWEQMMYDNLKNVGPIVYCGVANGGGHCFVCDGYNTSGYFHINWGWSGSYDGYFKLNALNPDGQGAGGFSGGYNTQQDATLGIQKPQTGSVKTTGYLAIEGTLTATASSKKITFKATSGGFYNMGSYAADFTVALAMTDASGNTQYVGSTSLGTVNPGYGTSSLALTVPSTVSSGSYTTSLVYKVGSGSWMPFKYHYGKPNAVKITVGSSSVTVNGTTNTSGDSSSSGDDSGSTTETGEVSVSSLTCTPSAPVVGQSVSVKATFKNTYTSAQSVSASAYLCTKGESNYSVAAAIGSAQTVSISASSTKSATFSGTLDSSLAAGTYYLVIANSEGYIISDIKSVTVTAGSSSGDDTPDDSNATFEVSALNVSPAAPVIGESVSIKATFKNTYSATKTMTASAYICSKSTSGYSIKATIGSAKSISVNSGTTKTYTYTGTVPTSLSAGTYYVLIANSDNNIVSEVKAVTISEAAADEPSTDEGAISCTSATSSTGFVVGEAYKVAATIKNTYSTTQSVKVQAYLCTLSSNQYSIQASLGSSTVSVAANGSKTANISGTLSSSLSAGNYYLVICDGNNKILNNASQVTVTMPSNDGEDNTGDDTSAEPAFTINSVTTSTGFTLGATCTLKVTFGNNGPSRISTKVKPKFFDANGELVDWLSAKTVTVTANSTKTITFSNKLYSNYPAGTYYLQFVDNNGNGDVVGNKTYKVTIKSASSTYSKFSVKSFTMANASAVDADNAQIDFVVEAGDEDVNEQFYALIFPENILDVSNISLAKFDSKMVAAGQTEKFSFLGALQNLEQGKSYSAVLFTLKGKTLFSGFDYLDTVNFTVKSAAQDAVEDITADDAADAPAAYYNLNGVRVAEENLTSGLYIKVSGGKAQKVLVK